MPLLVLGMALVAPVSGWAADRAAVPLHTPPPQTPIESAGTGLAPEVTVRVRLDVRGRVSQVEVLKIQPSSSYDELFERETRETVLRWRYAPATRDGQPVEATLQWTVLFPSRQGRQEEEASLRWRSFAKGDSSSQDYRLQVQGWAEEKFPALVLYLAEGYPGQEALREVYGSPAELEAQFREYVRSF